MKTKPEPKQRVLLIQRSDKDEVRITLPHGSRVTFGPTIPYAKNTMQHSDGYSLRVYEGKGNDTLIAVFCDVRSFRDITIPVQKLVLRESGKSLWKSDEDGYKVEQEVKVERSFQDEVKLLTS